MFFRRFAATCGIEQHFPPSLVPSLPFCISHCCLDLPQFFPCTDPHISRPSFDCHLSLSPSHSAFAKRTDIRMTINTAPFQETDCHAVRRRRGSILAAPGGLAVDRLRRWNAGAGVRWR